MSKRPSSSTKDRREVFDRCKRVDANGKVWLDCYLCGLPIDPVREKWECEHPTPRANGGTVTFPAHPACHKPKTARDISTIAKGVRIRDRHFNIKQSSSSFGGGWNKKFKRKISGEVVER